MNTFDIDRPVTAHSLNENLYKQFNVRINFDKYTREELEDYRNLLRTKVNQLESGANFNELLTNENYQKDKYVLGVLNTRIKEMLGEAKKIAEKKLSAPETKKKEKIVKSMKKDKGDFEKRYGKRGKEVMYATATKLAKKTANEAQVNELSPDTIRAAQSKRAGQLNQLAQTGAARAGSTTSHAAKASPRSLNQFHDTETKAINRDFDDQQRTSANYTPAERDAAHAHNDRNRGRNMSRGNMLNVANKKLQGTANVPAKSVEEGTKMKTTKKAKPDFLDMDKDGNKKEPMKKAVADKKSDKKGMSSKQEKFFGKKKVKEDRLLEDSKIIIEAVVHYLREDEEGKAKAITSGVDMVNDFTSWMQRVANYQTKTMIELSDSIRANFGVQEAETFKASVGSALETALNALTTTREEINNAVAVLAGEAPAAEPMGQEPGMDGMDGMDDAEMGMSEPDELNMPGEDEFAASDAAAGGPETLGRMKRESIDRGNRLMKILGA